MKFALAAVGVIAAASCASAFVIPVPSVTSAVRSSATRVNGLGKYDGEVWDEAAKQDVLSMFDPSKPRDEQNFDPYVKDSKGNKCDASGWYPGDAKYKDPIRPKTSYEDYLKQRAAEAEKGN